MPWAETCLMKLREEFVVKALEPGANVSELCREYRISRKTAYKWLKRFKERGVEGLADMTRRPDSNPLQASGEMVLEVIQLRRERPRWARRSCTRRSHDAALRTCPACGQSPELSTEPVRRESDDGVAQTALPPSTESASPRSGPTTCGR
jgi:transposase-like protein